MEALGEIRHEPKPKESGAEVSPMQKTMANEVPY